MHTVDVPILAGVGWVFAVIVVLAVVMAIKWIVDILP